MFDRIEPPTISRLILAAKPDLAEAEAALGLPLAGRPGRWSDASVRTLRTRPAEWLLRGAATLSPHAGLAHIASLTGSLAAWRLSGPNAAILLAMGGTLDFAGFGIWDGARTLVARISALVTMTDHDDFEVLVDTVHADYFGHWIRSAAERFSGPISGA